MRLIERPSLAKNRRTQFLCLREMLLFITFSICDWFCFDGVMNLQITYHPDSTHRYFLNHLLEIILRFLRNVLLRPF